MSFTIKYKGFDKVGFVSLRNQYRFFDENRCENAVIKLLTGCG